MAQGLWQLCSKVFPGRSCSSQTWRLRLKRLFFRCNQPPMVIMPIIHAHIITASVSYRGANLQQPLTSFLYNRWFGGVTFGGRITIAASRHRHGIMKTYRNHVAWFGIVVEHILWKERCDLLAQVFSNFSYFFGFFWQRLTGKTQNGAGWGAGDTKQYWARTCEYRSIIWDPRATEFGPFLETVPIFGNFDPADYIG